jgi:DNA polymerase
MKYVPGIGPSNAKLVICGEAPGYDEEQQGIPFVGATGQLVSNMMSELGVPIDSVYRTNVVKVRPPENDLARLRFIGRTIEEFIPQLREEIDALKPNAILAIGDLALRVLTGNKGIKKYRGSILYSPWGPKVIPTIHPASIFHSEESGGGAMGSWKDLTYIKWDFARAIAESKFPELDLPKRNLMVCRSSLDLHRFLDLNQGGKLVSVDIETFRTVPQCIAFAFNSSEAMSIPLFNIQSAANPEGIGRSEILHIWKDVADILADHDIQKIGQNFKFDQTLLERCIDFTTHFGLKTNGFHFDTQLAFRTLYAELPAKLEFISSVLTKEPYYKDEGKEYNPRKDRLDRWLLYNAKDAAVTFECYERELEELRERGLEDFFFECVMPLHFFYKKSEGYGISIDKAVNRELSQKYEMQRKALEDELLELTDLVPVNVMSNGLNGQVARLLFQHWKLPMRGSTDEKTLQSLATSPAVKNPKHRRAIELILEIRKVRKVIGTYINAETSPDGKMRTSVRIMLETGRTSTNSLKAPIATSPQGLAFQTITKYGDVGTDLRSQFVPDPGYVFLEADLAQAEDRVVGLLARDEKGMLFYEYGIDKHRIAASWILDRCPDRLLDQFFRSPNQILADEIQEIIKRTIDKEERQLGKMFVHACNYDIGERTAARNAEVSVFRARASLKKVHDNRPNIRGVFHKEIIEALEANNKRRLINPFGRERVFLNKWGNELFKEAYAQLPQSTITDITKFAGIRIIRRANWLQVLAESHDSLFVHCPINRVDQGASIMKEELETPVDFAKCSLPRGVLVIPCEVNLGEKNWESMRRIL